MCHCAVNTLNIPFHFIPVTSQWDRYCHHISQMTQAWGHILWEGWQRWELTPFWGFGLLSGPGPELHVQKQQNSLVHTRLQLTLLSCTALPGNMIPPLLQSLQKRVWLHVEWIQMALFLKCIRNTSDSNLRGAFILNLICRPSLGELLGCGGHRPCSVAVSALLCSVVDSLWPTAGTQHFVPWGFTWLWQDGQGCLIRVLVWR